MWAWVAQIFLAIFEDKISQAFWASVAFVLAIWANYMKVDETQMVVQYSPRLQYYLKAMDVEGKGESLKTTAKYNNSGVQFDYNADGKIDWYLGKSCDIKSVRTGKVGQWAIGNHVWVVVFDTQEAAFKKSDLPKYLDKDTIQKCRVVS